MAKYLIAEQEMFGKVHFRVVRTDGDRRVGGYHQIDLETLEDAQQIAEADIQRRQLGPSEIVIKRLGSQAFELHALAST